MFGRYLSNFSICLLIIFCLIFFISKLIHKPKIVLFIAILLLSFIAFFFDPVKAWLTNGNYTDLYRFYYDMDKFSIYGWNCVPGLLKTSYETILPIKILVYIIAKTKIYHLLQTITSLIVYGLLSIVIIDIGKKMKINNKNIINGFLIFLFLMNYKVVITNIRMPIGYALLFYVLCQDLIKHKKFVICLICYFLLCFIHSALIIFLILRLILYLFQKHGIKIASLVLLFYDLIFFAIYNSSRISTNISFINQLSRKIDLYSSSEILTIHNDKYIIILGILKIIVIITMLYYIYKSMKEKNIFKDQMKVFDYSIIVLMFTIGSFWSFHLFHRMTNFIIYLIVYWFLISKSDMIHKVKSKNSISIIDFELIVLCLIHLFYFFLSYQYNVLCF